MSPDPARTTRLAPSPTGALHLGNARTFLINWALARQDGWRIVLRIEDLDVQRVRPGADAQALEDLRWLGLDWDEGPVYQRADLSPYCAALESLRSRGMAYPCGCSRREIALAQSAPHAEDGAVRYPGTCRRVARPLEPSPVGSGQGEGSWLHRRQDSKSPHPGPLPKGEGEERPVAWRLAVPGEVIEFEDALRGPQCFNVQAEVGDFIIATKEGLPAYQLAVVVDDARQGVTEVVRGDDLLPSAARQLWLYRMLGVEPPPRYWHVPLVLDTNGRRMAKRHDAPRLTALRERGVPAERVVGLLASWCGMRRDLQPMTATEFLAGFNRSALPLDPVRLTEEEREWLRQ